MRHVNTVRDYCELLGKRLIEADEVDLGLQLIANGLVHDASKFHGIEWQYLHPNVERQFFDLALLQHVTTNKHHPEYWDGGIQEMPRLYLAEMICDFKARSSEFGTSLKDWVDDDASKRFGFTKKDEVYEDMLYFMNLVCDRPFKASEISEKE